MARPRKKNKKPMTSISVQEDLILQINKFKQRGRTYNDTINIILMEYTQYKEAVERWKGEIPVMEDLIRSQERKIQELNEVIEAMRKDQEEQAKRLVGHVMV